MKANGISRRAFLNGVSLGIAGTIAPIDFLKSQGIGIDYYPPTLTGIRGNHPGSFNDAHKLAFTGSGFIDEVQDLGESYDLVIVGGGISGLSAAHFFKERTTSIPSMLILDNHDDLAVMPNAMNLLLMTGQCLLMGAVSLWSHQAIMRKFQNNYCPILA